MIQEVLTKQEIHLLPCNWIAERFPEVAQLQNGTHLSHNEFIYKPGEGLQHLA
jgi:hypothetical protein